MSAMPIALGELDLDEVLRYMGTPPSQAGPELRALAEECGRAVCAAARPRWAWRAFDIAEEADGVRLSCGLLLPGQDLKRHLRGCGRAAVFCATLSAQVDALIRRWESGDMLRALALDCSAAAAVEQMCDQIELELQGHFPGCSFPFRYSPGYGDLPLELQNPLLDLLDAPRRVGQPHPHPPQVGDRYLGGGRRTHPTNCAQLSGLSRPGELPVSKVRWTLWNFVNC